MQFRAAVEIVFRDATGRVWLRESAGRLPQLKVKDPLGHFQTGYELNEPLDWQYPLRHEAH
jgi:hypothetical protein